MEPTKSIAVRLTPAYVVVPRKSMSGVFAATLKEYVACEYCPRKCDNRRTSFKGDYMVLKHGHDEGNY